MITETKIPTPTELQTRYQGVVRMILGHPQNDEVQKRVAAHLRAITDNKLGSVAMYHVAKSIPPEAKWELYNELASAIAANDWGKLQGTLAVGAKTIEPETAPATTEEAEKAESAEVTATRYRALVKVIASLGSEAESRVSTHIRAITAGRHKSLADYHEDDRIGLDIKAVEYAAIARALGLTVEDGKPKFGKPDWTKLQTAAPRTEPKRVDPLAEEPAEEPITPPRIPQPVTPASVPADDAGALAVLRKLLAPEPAAPVIAPQVDEGRVRLIVNEQLDQLNLHDVIKSANNNGAFPADRVQKLIADALAGMVHRVEIILPNGEAKPVEGIAHESFPVLLKMCAARVNTLLVGPTGSGKTHAAEQAAKALSLPFYYNGAIDTEYKLKGFIDAGGKVISPAFRKAWETGGVYLFDEVDASLPPAVLAFNGALSNHICDFPDRMVERHQDCIVIATGNTWLGGATFDYVGRMKQDAAFADRFATLHWDIDEKMELALASDKEWCQYVQGMRGKVKTHGLKVIVSPRATFHGEKLLAAGLDRAQVIASCVRKGMSGEQWSQVC
jgi:hypothetical protein